MFRRPCGVSWTLRNILDTARLAIRFEINKLHTGQALNVPAKNPVKPGNTADPLWSSVKPREQG
jgi:hypothetical protein